MQGVGLASYSGGQQIYAAPLCVRSSGQSYWPRDLPHCMQIKSTHTEIQITYLVSKQIAYDLRHLEPVPFPQLIAGWEEA